MSAIVVIIRYEKCIRNDILKTQEGKKQKNKNLNIVESAICARNKHARSIRESLIFSTSAFYPFSIKKKLIQTKAIIIL